MAPKIRHLTVLGLLATGGLLTPEAAAQNHPAQGFQDLTALERRVVISLGADIGEPGGPVAPIDRRLRLQPCPQQVTVEPPVLGAATIRCQPLGWRIRVPLVRARTQTQAPLQTAAVRPAQPQAESEIPMPTDAPVAAPTPVRTSGSSRPEPIVRRGSPVSLIVMTSGFTVTRSAVADQDGAVGDTIRIRTERGQQPIVGQVLPDGRILMPGFN